jgi:ribosomal protein S18 acetylase RimI-like enzyme
VREAERVELDAVVDVLRAANAEFAPVLPPDFYRAYLFNVLDVHGRLPDSRLLVAEWGSRIAGTITLYPDASLEGWDWPAHWAGIRAVAVHPEFRGHGIGRDLALACIAEARDAGAAAVCLHTAAFMGAAVTMYERLGFQRRTEFDRDAHGLFDPDQGLTRIVAMGYVLEL